MAFRDEPGSTSNQSIKPSAALDPLSKRELEVLHLVTKGMTNRKIGSALGISERTSREHVARILLKLRVRSRVEAAVIAAEARFEATAQERS
ncbi:LuxR C-terminal-related transcriptional regulator [Streptomyces sp. BE308]|uniref:response regulator transcription factor n=1 Tax=unclassified Streptomyces TaxID=2593676 RepID=UPI002E79FE51|nr:LuxR C-terminal-related transcriptional regulator [Streptomyces sp. BE308]MEE1796367.1 LuxR C-terminal-related transcriptional regulator [Streptomyces sp. BE308]